MTFTLIADKLGKNTIRVELKHSDSLSMVHVGVFRFSESGEKWNPIGDWRIFYTICNILGMTEQRLLSKLKSEKTVRFNVTAEEIYEV